MKAIEFVFNLVIGIILYIFSRSFRATVNAKMRGLNEPMNAGENVVAVLSSENEKRHIAKGDKS